METNSYFRYLSHMQLISDMQLKTGIIPNNKPFQWRAHQLIEVEFDFVFGNVLMKTEYV